MEMEEIEDTKSPILRALETIDKFGSITSKQVHTFFQTMGSELTKEQLDVMINNVDTEDHGNLDLKEFLTLVQMQLTHVDTEDEVVEAFKVFDDKGQGFIHSSELRRIMINLGDTLTDDEVDEIIKRSDIDGDCQVNYEEFSRIIFKERTYLTKELIREIDLEMEKERIREERERKKKERERLLNG